MLSEGSPVTSASERQPLAATRQRVREELRERILTGRLRPGDRLVERELAEDLGVSRVPVREAIRSLEAEGFLVVQSPRRVVVRQLARVDVEELFDVREALEGLAAGLAASRAGAAELKRLERVLADAARATARGDAARITVLNSRFHDEIVAIAGNALLTTMLQPLEEAGCAGSRARTSTGPTCSTSTGVSTTPSPRATRTARTPKRPSTCASTGQ